MVWLGANIGTIAVLLVLIVIVSLIVRVIVRDKKAGRSSCGAGCANCPMHGKCHKAGLQGQVSVSRR